MRALPLADYEVGRAQDVEGARRVLEVNWRKLRVDHATESTWMDFRLHGTRLDRMSFSAMSFGAETIADSGPLGLVVIMLPLSGWCEVWSGDQIATIRQGRAAVLSPMEGVGTRWSADCAQVLVVLESDLVEDVRQREFGVPAGEPLQFDLELDVRTGPGQKLVFGLLYPLVKRLDRHHRMFEGPETVADIENLAASALLNVQRHNYSV
nr:hypothetical protein [Phytoactinopolyspora alkaliphila]